jgi:murein DD-endopeptidase MepM/ murein hydrolase activator NlpD
MTHSFTRTALLAAAATVLTACASTPAYPTAEGQAAGTGPQRARPAYPVQQTDSAETDGDPSMQARPSGTVQTAQLPPPSGTAVAPPSPVESRPLPSPETEYTPPPLSPPPAAAYTPPPAASYSPPPPPPAPVTRTVVLAPGKVIDADGRPKTYTVKEGQGLDAVARAMGSSRAELAKINGLKEPYALKPGQVLKGPASRTKAYVVERGDTLFQIARRFSVSAAALAEENDIEVSDSLRVGQKIKLPAGYKDKGPEKKTITVTPPPAATPAPTTSEPPRILAGQSPYPGSPPRPVSPPPASPPPPPPAAYVPPQLPPPPPPVTRPASPPPPVATRPTSPPPPVVATPPVTTRPPATRPASPPPPVATRPTPVPPVTRPVSPPPPPVTTPRPPAGTAPLLPSDTPPNLSDAEIAALGRGRFQWPVKGNVISDYGPKGAGRRNDGVDIGAPAGSPVRSASAGKVVYSGGEVPGFGVTVLIQHEDGWVTVYGNLQTATARIGENLAAGQQIGTVGTSGGAPQPQLHFEVRYSPSPRFKAKAIDPALVLPR